MGRVGASQPAAATMSQEIPITRTVRAITRTVRAAMVSLSVSFASWEKSVEDQQQLLVGKAFKSIPSQPANLAFVQEAK